jgi:AAA family ATP:ADP antiporter
MQKLIARLNLEEGEGRLVAVLLALAFCVGLTRLFNSTASGTLFLTAFDSNALPYIYVLVAVVIPLIGLLNTKLESKVSLTTLLAGNLLGYLLVLGGLRLSMSLTSATWPVFAFSVWSEVGWVVTNLTLWGLAGRLLNVRQAKRLFGLIGAGGVVAAVAGGFLMPVIVDLIGTVNLLIASVISLSCSFGLLIYAAKAFKGINTRSIDEPSMGAVADGMSSTRSRYIGLIAALGMISYAAFYFVDNIFYNQVEVQFPNESQLASFLGVFLAVMNLLTVFANLFLVGPIISRFGMRTGLLLMPGLTALVSGTMVIGGTFLALPGLAFSLATLNDLLDWVLRDTIFKSAVLILYQPLPPSQRLRVQTLVESVVQPIAQGLAGLGLLGLGLLAFNALQLNLVLLVLLVVCVALAILLGRDYGPALREALVKRFLHFSGATLAVNDADSLAILRRELNSPIPANVAYAFDKLEELSHPDLSKRIIEALQHPAPEVRKDSLLRIERLGLKSATEAVQALLQVEKDRSVKGAAVRVLATLSEASVVQQLEPFLVDTATTVRISAMAGMLRSDGSHSASLVTDQLTQMVGSPDVTKRLQAAQVLGRVGEGRQYLLVLKLLQDSDVKVRQTAIAAAGKIKSPRLWPSVIDALSDPSTRQEALTALVGGGDQVLLSLRAALARPELKPVLALRLLRIAGRIRGQSAILFLKDWIASEDQALRHQALLELERCRYQASDRERIEQLIRAEAAGAAQTLATLTDVRVADSEAVSLLERALIELVDDGRERILSLLSFISDSQTFTRVRASLDHASIEKRAYGLEVLESLAGSLKPIVLPLLEELPPEKVLARLPFRPEHKSRAGWLNELQTGDQWVNVCARYELGDISMMSLIEKVMILRTVSIFAGVPESILAEVAALLAESQLKLGETLFAKGEAGDCLYIIVQGRLRVHDGERLLSQLDDRDVVGEMAVLDSSPRLASVTAETDTILLKLEQGPLYELMADRVEVARGIIHVLTRRLRDSMRDLADLQAQLDMRRQ